MADLLIMARDNTHENPVKDKRGCYKIGDIVDAFPDGQLGPHAHAGGVFKVIRAPQLSLEEAKSLCVPETEVEYIDGEGRPHERIVAKRRHRIELEKLGLSDRVDRSEFEVKVKCNINRVVYDKKERKYRNEISRDGIAT